MAIAIIPLYFSSNYFDNNKKEIEAENLPQDSIDLQANQLSNGYPHFKRDEYLDSVIREVIADFENVGISSQDISINLVNLKHQNFDSIYSYAEHQSDFPRFPASLVKVFWAVILLEQEAQGLIDRDQYLDEYLYKMLHRSDNEAASKVVDLITSTVSGESLSSNSLQGWIDRRESMNHYFESLGYKDINITQKTFPIPYLNANMPEGRDLQMRGDPDMPLRNSLTTSNVARLLLEIETDQVVSPEHSQALKRRMSRNLHPDTWQHIPFNWIGGFLGESLPTSTRFVSKAGWTSQVRHDAAIVGGFDQPVHYILVVFSEGEKASENENIFPLISYKVYKKLLDNPH